jgi:hypothetical protein
MALAGYYVVTLGYSLALKRVMAMDVITLAILYTLRIFAGAMACGLTVSFWILAFLVFIFLSLAFVKRYAELEEAGREGYAKYGYGRAYRPDDQGMISALGSASGYISVMVLALYLRDPVTVTLYRHPAWLWFACLLLFFGSHGSGCWRTEERCMAIRSFRHLRPDRSGHRFFVQRGLDHGGLNYGGGMSTKKLVMSLETWSMLISGVLLNAAAQLMLKAGTAWRFVDRTRRPCSQWSAHCLAAVHSGRPHVLRGKHRPVDRGSFAGSGRHRLSQAIHRLYRQCGRGLAAFSRSAWECADRGNRGHHYRGVSHYALNGRGQICHPGKRF